MTDTTNQELLPAARKELTAPISFGDMGVFSGNESFALAQRMASCLASSNYVPVSYQLRWLDDKKNEWHENPNAIGNCVMALELANRWRISPLMVMQNVDMVRGRPGLRGALVKGLIDTSGVFLGLTRYEWKGEEENPTACRLIAIDKTTGEQINGTWITLDMVKAEGWLSNSKWTSMRAQMFMYRAASFFGRAHTPHLLLGLPSAEEIEDIALINPRASVDALNARLSAGDPLPDTEGQEVTHEDTKGPSPSPIPTRHGRKPRNAPTQTMAPLEQAESAEHKSEPEPEKAAELPAPSPAQSMQAGQDFVIE